MANNYFRFKQFTVFHDQCAMKVGTDGVLIGSWCSCLKANRILDIGSGSGLIALMLAQRNPKALIDGVEIDIDAYKQACDNVNDSPFSNRIRLHCTNLLMYDTPYKYDFIVSNPPFFVDALPSPDAKRTQARHHNTLTAYELIKHSASMLSQEGILSVIYPFSMQEEVMSIAEKEHLFPQRVCTVYSKKGVPPKRILLEFSFKEREEYEQDQLIIESDRHVYTPEFKQLTKSFYL